MARGLEVLKLVLKLVGSMLPLLVMSNSIKSMSLVVRISGLAGINDSTASQEHAGIRQGA